MFQINLFGFWKKTDWNFLYCACFTRVRVGILKKFILKHRLYIEEILDLEGLLVTANLIANEIAENSCAVANSLNRWLAVSKLWSNAF